MWSSHPGGCKMLEIWQRIQRSLTLPFATVFIIQQLWCLQYGIREDRDERKGKKLGKYLQWHVDKWSWSQLQEYCEETRGKTKHQKSNLTYHFPLSFCVGKCVSLVFCVSCVDITWLDKDPSLPSSCFSLWVTLTSDILPPKMFLLQRILRRCWK